MLINRFLSAVLGCALVMLAGTLTSIPAIRAQTDSDPIRRVNAPDFGREAVAEHTSAIFWLGRVTPTDNYVDMRVGYNQTELVIRANVFDRRIWYSDAPAPNNHTELVKWDALTVYLHTDDNAAILPSTPTTSTYRITVQANWPNQGDKYQALAHGDGAGYIPITATLSSDSLWRGDGPNNDADDRGYIMTIRIPFGSLGRSAPPPYGSTWRMGVQGHDRDDAASTPQYSPTWPEALDPQQVRTWGLLGFGLPQFQAPAATSNQQLTTIRHKLNTASVTDATVGGGTTCADNYDYFAEFGNINHAGAEHANVQNQGDVADWPCFSKFYLTFPLDQLPTDKTLISATLTIFQFGNSGQGIPPPPVSTLIQAIVISETWREVDLTWNTAPLAFENISMARSLPMDPPPAGQAIQSVPVVLDVGQAVSEALRTNRPLQLVLYSADGAQNSGKYFWTADVDDGLAEVRPTLRVNMGTPIDLTPLSLRVYMPIARRD